jgi:acyl carrier protein
MTDEQIVSKIRRIIEEDIGIQNEYQFDQSLLKSGFMDSMDWIAFLTRIEDEFSIDISSEDATKNAIAILNNLVEYLKTKIK